MTVLEKAPLLTILVSAFARTIELLTTNSMITRMFFRKAENGQGYWCCPKREMTAKLKLTLAVSYCS